MLVIWLGFSVMMLLLLLWRLITASSQAKLVPPPPPGNTAHACGGHPTHVLFQLLTAALSGNPKALPWKPDMEIAFAAFRPSSPWSPWPTPPRGHSRPGC
jgi:hypothetical protein